MVRKNFLIALLSVFCIGSLAISAFTPAPSKEGLQVQPEKEIQLASDGPVRVECF